MTLDGKPITIEQLIEGHDRWECVDLIARLDSSMVKHLFNILSYERMERKSLEIMETLKETSNNWHLTMLIVLMRFIGGKHNRRAAERLARIVTPRTIMLERSSLIRLEALLLGSAGLLDIYAEDDYIRQLREEFEHLAAKYSITPMLPGEWQLSGFYPNNHPTLRLAQLAASFHYETLTLHSVVLCRNRKEVHKLFSGKASEYWVRNFIPHDHNCMASSRIGAFTSDILGINFIVQMEFAYGKYIESNQLIEHAIGLLEQLPSEQNKYTKLWNSCSTITRSAYDSQAIIQLTREYCEKNRCEKCPLARILTTYKLEL